MAMCKVYNLVTSTTTSIYHLLEKVIIVKNCRIPLIHGCLLIFACFAYTGRLLKMQMHHYYTAPNDGHTQCPNEGSKLIQGLGKKRLLIV